MRIRGGVVLLALFLLPIFAVTIGSSPVAASTSAHPDDHRFKVDSASMEPTLQIGDWIVVDENPSDFLPLRAGDIIVFRTPQRAKTMCATDDGDLVKRVVATRGEWIWSKGNAVYVSRSADGANVAPQNESYLPKGTQLGQPIVRQQVPRNDVFVLGDNRSISCDSRVWGPVPGKDVVGKVVLACSTNGSNPCKQPDELGESF